MALYSTSSRANLSWRRSSKFFSNPRHHEPLNLDCCHETMKFDRKIIFFWLRIALAIVTFAFVINWVKDQPTPEFPTSGRAYLFLGLAVICLIPALILRALKWLYILKPVYGEDVTFKDSLKSYLGAMPLALMTPGRVGELARMLYLKPSPGGKLQGAFLVAIDKVSDLGCLLFWCVGATYLFFNPELSVLVALATIVVLSAPMWIVRTQNLSMALLKLFRINPERVSFLQQHNYSAKQVTLISLCGILCFGIEWFQVWCLLSIWSNESASLFMVSQVMAFVTLANALPLTPAGLGVREGLAGYWLMKYAFIPPAIGAAAAFLLFVIDILIPVGIGLKLKTYQENHG